MSDSEDVQTCLCVFVLLWEDALGRNLACLIFLIFIVKIYNKNK